MSVLSIKQLAQLAAIALAGAVATGLASAAPAAASAFTDAHERGWVRQPSLGLARAGADVATTRGQIFVVGGFGPTHHVPSAFASVEARSVGGPGVWHDVAPLPTGRANLMAAAHDGRVYAIGGLTIDNENSDVVEVYHPRTNTWRRGPRLPDPRYAAGAAALGGRIYVAGGGIGVNGDFTSSVVVLDPKRGTWRNAAPMPTPRAFLRLVAVGRYLYAVGGLSETIQTLPTLERYDPATNTWRTMKPMHQTRGIPGVTVTKVGRTELIVAVGGAQHEGGSFRQLRTTEVYDPTTNRWQLLDVQLPTERASLVCAVDARGNILAIGGEFNVDGFVTADVHALDLRHHLR